MTLVLDEINSGRYKSVLCLNGDLPPSEFFTSVNVPIFAADGGANRLIDIGIVPLAVIGDLDSISESVRNTLDIFEDLDQSKCDFEKAIDYLKNSNLLPCVILGMNGGLIDHILNNIGIFSRSQDNMFYAPPIMGYIINSTNTKILHHPKQAKISLIPLPSVRLSTKGLKWELQNVKLEFGENTSAFNRGLGTTTFVEVHAGKVLALVYEDFIYDAGCL